VVYPPAGATLTASDSTFIFGSVQPADAPVSVNGVPADQSPGGGWLAWVPITPGDFVFQVEARSPPSPSRTATGKDRVEDVLDELFSATRATDMAALDWRVRVPGGFQASWNGIVDTSSVTPRDTLELEPGNMVRVRFKGIAGLRGRAMLGEDFASAPLLEEAAVETNGGRQVFGEVDTSGVDQPSTARDLGASGGPDAGGAGTTAIGWSWYAAELTIPLPLPAPPPPPAGANDQRRSGKPTAWTYGSSAPLEVEIEARDSTLRLTLASTVVLRDPAARAVAILDDDPSRTGHTDGTVVGRTAPDGVYFLFLPNGTYAATGRRSGGFVELRLAQDLSVWAAAGEVHALPPGTPTPASRVPVVRTRRLGKWTRITVPLSTPLPVQVRQQTDPARYQVTIFGARAATEFLRYDFGDPLIKEVRWDQPSNDRFVLDVELDQRQPWGFRYGFDGSDFHLDVRRAPRLRSGLFSSILKGSILKGLKIVVDPGHSPDSGATGPTGLQEKDANLLVALELARELFDKGAEVIMTRFGDATEDFVLNDRTNLAAREEADLLVSVHHNALPDGVNPFLNNGSSTYYYQPQSLPLARAIQAELLKELGLPDFGVALGNLALARPTEMPAVLTEAAFMMIPEQEELLRSEAFRKREAKAIRKGIERFLEDAKRRERNVEKGD
jgi:N-acetylmuramoyl-L-alanine amidase